MSKHGNIAWGYRINYQRGCFMNRGRRVGRVQPEATNNNDNIASTLDSKARAKLAL